MKLLKRGINLFLDTTPRQWLRLFANAFMAICHKEQVTFCGSLIIHASVFALLFVYSDHLAVSIHNKTELVELEFGAIDAPIQVRAPDDFGFDQDSNIVVPLPQKKIVKLRKLENKDSVSSVQKLLAKYRNLGLDSGRARMDRSHFDGMKPFGAALASKSRPSHFMLPDDDDDGLVKSDDTRDNQRRNQERWLNHIASYQERFQGCYEGSLLADATLNGRIHFVLQTNMTGQVSSSIVDFSGVGDPLVKADLVRCLKGVLELVQFPDDLATGVANKKIGFEAVLTL